MTEWCITRVAAAVGAIAAAVAEDAMQESLNHRGELISDQLPSGLEFLEVSTFQKESPASNAQSAKRWLTKLFQRVTIPF